MNRAREAGDSSPSSRARRRVAAMGLPVRLVRARTTLNPFWKSNHTEPPVCREEVGEKRRSA